VHRSLLPSALLALFTLTPFGLAACGARSEGLFASTTNPSPSSSASASASTPLGPPPEHIYVVDARIDGSPGRLTRFDSMSGAGWTTWSGAPAGLTDFCGVALDAKDRIYLGGGVANEVVRIDSMSGGGAIGFSQSSDGSDRLGSVFSVALDAQGRIYAVDHDNNRIVRVDDMTGAGWTTLGGPNPGAGDGELDGPFGIAVSASGKILISDYNNNRLVEVDDMTGTGWKAWTLPVLPNGGAQFGSPYGVAYDGAGRIYAAEFQSSTLYRIDSIAGDGLQSFGPKFIQLGHVFVHSSGRIYLTMLNAAGPSVVEIDDMSGTGLTTFGEESSTDGVGHYGNACGVFAR
jgi:streptogramin lyase